MESQEGKNFNLSNASSKKSNRQVGPALWANCAKTRFSVSKQLGRNGVLPGNHRFLSFRHWLLVEPLEWNEIRISGDLSSPLTRDSLCRRLLSNGIIVRLPRSSKKTDPSYSSFSFPMLPANDGYQQRPRPPHRLHSLSISTRFSIFSLNCVCKVRKGIRYLRQLF